LAQLQQVLHHGADVAASDLHKQRHVDARPDHLLHALWIYIPLLRLRPAHHHALLACAGIILMAALVVLLSHEGLLLHGDAQEHEHMNDQSRRSVCKAQSHRECPPMSH
jgi:hypothetical protein